MTFPIRYKDETTKKIDIMGFLTFDLPHKNGFKHMPEIYKHFDENSVYKYNEKLNNCAVFHLGGSIADILSLILYKFYRNGDN